MPESRADIRLWGRRIGAVEWDDTRRVGVFAYTPGMVNGAIEVAPFAMPLRDGVFDFPSLGWDAFKGLPGLLADSLPDKFGNALINAWLTEQGRDIADFNPVERLCYVGRRGMGALEFEPATGTRRTDGGPVDIAPLVELASRVLNRQNRIGGVLEDGDTETIQTIMRVGTSAGGARAKAVLAWNEKTGEFHSGQLAAGEGFTQWLFKFDGVASNGDRGLTDPQGFGRLEYAYSIAAQNAGITMARCRLHEEGGRAHFMTQRFDRVDGEKLHMQSLGALRHFDYNMPGAHGYEQVFDTIRRLGLGQAALEEQFRRAVFNVVLRNQDDHVKNIAFLMNRAGEWRLSPAYDITYAYDPANQWMKAHQMTIGGRSDGFTRDDLLTLARQGDIKTRRANRIIDRILDTADTFQTFAEQAGVFTDMREQAMAQFRALPRA